MNELKMLNQEELAALLNVSREQVATLREVGVIRAIKTGKCYMFSQEEIRRFQRDYAGLDVSNKVKAIEAYNAVENTKTATAATVTTKATYQKRFR